MFEIANDKYEEFIKESRKGGLKESLKRIEDRKNKKLGGKDMSTKYRKIPVEIEAIELRSDNIRECTIFIEGSIDLSCKMAQQKWEEYLDICVEQGGIYIHTLEGKMFAKFGDYIIKGVKGEFYPCKPDIFGMTYEEVK